MTQELSPLANIPRKPQRGFWQLRHRPAAKELGILGKGWRILTKIITEIWPVVAVMTAWVNGWLPKRMVPVLIFVVALLVCLFFWRVLRRTVSYAWGILDPGSGASELLRLGFDAEGNIKPEKLPRRKIVKAQFVPRWKADEPSRSLAFATNGVMLASLIEHSLSISKINAQKSRVRQWEEPIPIEYQNSRVVAVAPKGDGDAWLAIVNGDGTLLWGSYSDLRRGEKWKAFGAGPSYRKATHAAFVGDRLLYDSSTVTGLFPGGNLDPYLHGKTLIALDAAKVGGRTYLAVIAADVTTGSDACQLIVARVGDSTAPFVRELHPRPTHLTVVRSPEGARDRVCVLLDTESAPIFPFLHSPLGSDRVRPRHRKPDVNVTPGVGQP